MPKKINVLIDTSPLGNAHAHRGIGTYTKLLVEHLEKYRLVEVLRSQSKKKDDPKPNIVHYPYFDLFFSTLPLNHPAPKQVVTIHDVIPLNFPDHYPAGVKGGLRFVKQQLALKKIDAVITDSEASKTDIEKHLGIEADKIHVVYLAANPKLQAAAPKKVKAVKEKYSLPEKYVLYVGDINYNKNIPQLIKAVKYLPKDVHLVAVGKNFVPQEIEEWQWIEAQIAMSDVSSRIKFLSNVADTQELAALYTGAECYVQPSLYEGFGLPVIEAMQCKTPVVVTNNSSLTEIASPDTVLVETDAENIAKGVTQILEMTKVKRQEIIKNNFQWSQKFSWDKVAKDTAKVYRLIEENKKK
jgi:glycosyltransferase involved in cell wall biosynthesis